MPLHELLKLVSLLPHSWILSAIVYLLQTGGQYFEEEGSHLGVPPLYLSQLEYAQTGHTRRQFIRMEDGEVMTA